MDQWCRYRNSDFMTKYTWLMLWFSQPCLFVVYWRPRKMGRKSIEDFLNFTEVMEVNWQWKHCNRQTSHSLTASILPVLRPFNYPRYRRPARVSRYDFYNLTKSWPLRFGAWFNNQNWALTCRRPFMSENTHIAKTVQRSVYPTNQSVIYTPPTRTISHRHSYNDTATIIHRKRYTLNGKLIDFSRNVIFCDVYPKASCTLNYGCFFTNTIQYSAPVCATGN